MTSCKRKNIKLQSRNKKTDFDTPTLMLLLLPPWRPAVTLTFDLQKQIRSSLGASDYSLWVLSKLFRRL